MFDGITCAYNRKLVYSFLIPLVLIKELSWKLLHVFYDLVVPFPCIILRVVVSLSDNQGRIWTCAGYRIAQGHQIHWSNSLNKSPVYKYICSSSRLVHLGPCIICSPTTKIIIVLLHLFLFRDFFFFSLFFGSFFLPIYFLFLISFLLSVI